MKKILEAIREPFAHMSTRYLAFAAIIAAVYAAVTALLAPISYGGIQVRISEALTVLPILTPAAVPGLTIGCLLANIYGATMGVTTVFDIVFGTLASLIAALLTRCLRKKPVIAMLPPVLVNGLIVGLMLSLMIENFPFYLAFLSVSAGQIASCYALGLPLLWALKRLPERTFSRFFDK